MDAIKAAADEAYHGVLAYIKKNDNDANSFQGQLILAALKTTICATSRLPSSAAPGDQPAPAVQSQDAAIKEGSTRGSNATQSEAPGASHARSDVASDTPDVQTVKDVTSSDNDRSVSSQSGTIATSTTGAGGAEPAAQATADQASKTTPQTERTPESTATQSTATSASASRSSNTGGASVAAESTPASITANTATPSANDKSKQGLVPKIHTSDSPKPENLFDRSELSDKRFSDTCFNITNCLCKWLQTNATKYKSLSDLDIEASGDYSKVVNGKPRWRITPISGLRKMADVIQAHQVAIHRQCVDQLKWMLDYRCAETAKCMQDPLKDEEEDETHDHFNDVVREVYEVLKRLPSPKENNGTSAHTEHNKSDADSKSGTSQTSDSPKSSAQSDSGSTAQTGTSTACPENIAEAAAREQLGMPKTWLPTLGDSQRDYLSEANEFTGRLVGSAWTHKATITDYSLATYDKTTEVDLRMPKDIRSKSVACSKRSYKLIKFLVEHANEHEDPDIPHILELIDGVEEVSDTDWRFKLGVNAKLVDMAEILGLQEVEIDPAFLEEMRDLLNLQKAVAHWYGSQPVRFQSSLADDNRTRQNFNAMLFEVISILNSLPLKES